MPSLPNQYSDILNSAQRDLVRMPDGSYRAFPREGQPTSLDEIYRGILPSPPAQSLTSRSVTTVPIDNQTGQPLGFYAPTMAATLAEQRSGSRPAVTVGSQPAGMVAMPPGARPASIDQAFALMGIQPSGGMGRGRPTLSGPSVWDPFGTQVAKDETRLPVNAGEREFMNAFYPQEGNAAVAAINAASGVPMPRPRPMIAPVPRQRAGMLSQSPSANGGGYTIRKGDTLSQIAKNNGMTVQQIMAMNPQITNANKIVAGRSLNLGQPVQVSATSSPRRMSAPAPVRSVASKPRETFDQVWAEAKGLI